MGKPYYLKKTYIRDSINSFITRIIMKILSCKFKDKNKIVIRETDGIGDIFVKDGVAQLLIKKFGKENIVFLMQKNYADIGEILGYPVIGISKDERIKLIPRIKKTYEINKLGIKKFINLDTTNDAFIAGIIADEIIGANNYYCLVKKYNKYFTKSFDMPQIKYIMDELEIVAEKILETKITKKDLEVDLTNKFDIKNELIVIAVGSTERQRVCSPKKMIKYVREILKSYPDEKIYLIGNGKRQQEYAEELIKLDENIKFENLIDKTSLTEAFGYVAKSKLFLGFESGLYNLSFVLKKKGIIFFREKENPFYHDVPYLKILLPDQEKADVKDEIYFNEKINSISVEQFSQALNSLKNI